MRLEVAYSILGSILGLQVCFLRFRLMAAAVSAGQNR